MSTSDEKGSPVEETEQQRVKRAFDRCGRALKVLNEEQQRRVLEALATLHGTMPAVRREA